MVQFRGKVNRLILFLLVLLLFVPVFASAEASAKNDVSSNNVTVYFFWGDGCPHCEAEMPFIENLEGKYPQLQVVYLETWHNKSNAEMFVSFAKM